MEKLPKITPELLEYLEGICPDKAPSVSIGERELWVNVGKVQLTRHLRSIFEEQQENILQGD
jgi:hypothetical protein